MNSNEGDVGPYVLLDNSALYFGTNRDGNYDIVRAENNGGTFAGPLAVPGTMLATVDVEETPVVSADELTLFLYSDRDGGEGDTDIWVATRGNPGNAFSAPENVQSLNTRGPEWPTWLSADGCVPYFTRDSVGDGYELWYAERGQ